MPRLDHQSRLTLRAQTVQPRDHSTPVDFSCHSPSAAGANRPGSGDRRVYPPSREHGSHCPDPHATAEEVEAARDDPKLANVLYHDWEAATYDEKWSISYDERCITYARDRFAHVAGTGAAWPYGRGAGARLRHRLLPAQPHAGRACSTRGTVTDICPGMVEVALRNAERLGLDVDGPGRRRRDDPVRRRDLRPGRRARGAAPHPGRRAGAARGAAGAQAGRPVRVRRRADPRRRLVRPPARPGYLVGRPPGSPGCRALRGRGAGRRRSSTSRPGRRRWRRSSTCTRSTRPTLRRLALRAGAVDVRASPRS